MTDGRLLIDGELVEAVGGARATSFDPGSGRQVGSFSLGGPEDVEAAVRAARRAFDEGPWPRFSPAERAERVIELADLLLAHVVPLSRLEALDSGGLPVRTASDVMQGSRLLRRLARLSATTFPWREELPAGSPLFPGRSHVVREPIGVCAAIIPWNFPLLMALWKIAMATVTGNTLVLKPAPDTPLSALSLGELVARSRIPRGVVNIVTGPGREPGEALVRHPLVDRVAFTGSTAVGRRVLEAAAGTVKRVTLELGGKSAGLLLRDADLDLALDSVLFGSFLHSGQVCESCTRLLVPEEQREAVVAELASRARQIRVGHQLDPATGMGPLINRTRRDEVERFIALGISEGATLVCGGHRVEVPGCPDGTYLAPTIFDGVTPEMTVAREEIFGPVLAVLGYRDEDEAVSLANGTDYGLAAGIWSRDLARAERLASRLKAGTVWINDWHAFHDLAPFGGYRRSGFGRELGRHGLESYTEVKHVHVGTEGEASARLGPRTLRPRPAPLGYEHEVRTRIISGPGSVCRLASELGAPGERRFLLVTDAGVVRAGLVDRVLAAAGGAVVAIFEAVPQDSGLGVVDAAVEAGRRAGASGVLSVGGGSVIDTGKVVALGLGLGLRAIDLLGQTVLEGTRSFHAVVPTTAGTGSEVTNVAVLRNERVGRKSYVVDPLVTPDLAILDPAMTTSLPPGLTASTAMDALTHAVEAYVSRKANPIADAHALHAIRLIATHLQRAVRDGTDLEARSALLSAANLAGQAITSARVGLVHAMSHALGARYRVPHGAGNGVLLPHVIRWNGAVPAVATRYADVAVALGAAAGERERSEGGAAAAERVEALLDACGHPRWLAPLGVPDDDLEACAFAAFGDLALLTNPRLPASPRDVATIFRQALGSA